MCRRIETGNDAAGGRAAGGIAMAAAVVVAVAAGEGATRCGWDAAAPPFGFTPGGGVRVRVDMVVFDSERTHPNGPLAWSLLSTFSYSAGRNERAQFRRVAKGD